MSRHTRRISSGGRFAGLTLFLVACGIIAVAQLAERMLDFWPLLLAGGAGWLGWWLRRHRRRGLARAPAVKVMRAKPDRRAVANGWAAPTRQALVQVSGPCAGQEHVFCHEPRCQCECDHPSRDLPERTPF